MDFPLSAIAGGHVKVAGQGLQKSVLLKGHVEIEVLREMGRDSRADAHDDGSCKGSQIEIDNGRTSAAPWKEGAPVLLKQDYHVVPIGVRGYSGQ